MEATPNFPAYYTVLLVNCSSEMILERSPEKEMKPLRILGIILVFVLSCSATVGAGTEDQDVSRLDAAEPLTPDDLYEIALRHNPDHQKYVQNATLSGVTLRSAWGTLMPTANASYQISQDNYYYPTYVNPDGTVSTLDEASEGKYRSSSAAITLQESLNLGGQQYFTIKNASIQNRMNRLLVASSEKDLRYNVAQNYYIVLANKRLLELANRVLEQKREQLRLARARFEVGSVTELDVLQAEIDVGNQENAVIEAENNLKLAREELNRTLGVALDSKYPLVDEFRIFQPQFTLEALIDEAIHNRPDYLYYQDQEKYQKNNVKINFGEFLPNLSAALSYIRSENSGAAEPFTFEPRNRDLRMSLTLSWKIFSGFSREESYQQSRVALKNARYDRNNQELLIEQEVRQAYYTLMQTYEQSKVTAKNRELGARQLALEQERYRLGATSQLNLRTAQVTYEQAETDYIANIFSFWSNLAALERAVGKKLR